MLYRHPVDMRKSFDGLCYLIENEMHCKSVDGSVYIFINKTRRMMKLLQWQEGGFVLYYKRLEQGSFPLKNIKSDLSSHIIGYWDLVSLIEGISVLKIRQGKRFKTKG